MASRPKRRRGARRPASPHTVTQHTSVPTGRVAYAETRIWLLDEYGPICAYCGVAWPPRTLTLDHVTPRKGQTAYDRRDNLVLACKRCNTAKADKPFLAYLFAQRARAVNLLHYGQHLSEGILDLCRQLAGPEATAAASAAAVARRAKPRLVYGAADDQDDDSPYLEDSPYA